MASIIQIGSKHRVQIRRAGHPTVTKTFPTVEAAQEWADSQEGTIKANKLAGIKARTGLTLAEAVSVYQSESKDMSKTATDVMKCLSAGMGHLHLDKMTDDDIVAYIKGRKFSAASGALHFSFLRSVLNMAKVGWKYHVPDILDQTRDRLKILGLIGKSEERDRRLTEREFNLLTSYEFKTDIPMQDIIRFAVLTAMRQAEITRIKRNSLDEKDKTIVIEDRKHPTKKQGNHQVVPLLNESIEIIKRQEGRAEVFPYDPKEVGRQFANACKELGITGVTFHTLRHEGASRLFERGYRIEQVALFTGHTDWKMLKRYTHLKAKDLEQL